MHLSGGQAQRAVIARALALNPKILVCDESTSMLDPTTQKSIVELLDKLVKEKNISLLFISHDTHLVDDFAMRRLKLKTAHSQELRVVETKRKKKYNKP